MADKHAQWTPARSEDARRQAYAAEYLARIHGLSSGQAHLLLGKGATRAKSGLPRSKQ